MFCVRADVLVICPQKPSNAFRVIGGKILARQNRDLFYGQKDLQSKKVEMDKSEMMIAVLRHQKILLEELISTLEHTELLALEDYSFCGARTQEILRNLKSVRRSALNEMGKCAAAREALLVR